MPIYITENGYAAKGEAEMSAEEAIKDADRVKYFQGYLGAVRDAVEDGVDIRSYFAWSFYDNFEWSSGLVPRFGCVRVDYDTMERTVKDSARAVQVFFEENISKLKSNGVKSNGLQLNGVERENAATVSSGVTVSA